jgi:hypothetical protein
MTVHRVVSKRDLAKRLNRYRNRTKRLIGPLNDDDVHRQYHSIMSPLVWDVGHVGNFEELWLLREIGGRPAHDPRYDKIYNPFDNPRWTSGDLALLNRSEAFEYIDEVRGDALALLKATDLEPSLPLLRDGYVYEMVIQHEAQHQETILQALDLREDLSPYQSAVLDQVGPLGPHVDDTHGSSSKVASRGWVPTTTEPPTTTNVPAMKSNYPPLPLTDFRSPTAATSGSSTPKAMKGPSSGVMKARATAVNSTLPGRRPGCHRWAADGWCEGSVT